MDSKMVKYLYIATSLAVACFNTQAKIVTAASLNEDDVITAIARARPNDTVMVPAGNASWGATLAISKPITLQGAGIGKSIVYDEAARRFPWHGLVLLKNYSTNELRLTGFSFYPGVTNAGRYAPGLFQAIGSGSLKRYYENMRIDHCVFSNLYAAPVIQFNDTFGVIDHCHFYNGEIFVEDRNWAGYTWGNGSWADNPYWGSGKFMFIENNVFVNKAVYAVVDSYEGARWVFRHNICTNGTLCVHGTEGQGRGGKEFECYRNTFVSRLGSNLGQIRSGSALIWGNSFIGWTRPTFFLQNYRYFRVDPNWSSANGFNPWDSNDVHGIYYSGINESSNGSSTLIDTNATWTSNQWVGYVVINKSRRSKMAWAPYSSNPQSQILWNDSDSLGYILDSSPHLENPKGLIWNNGDKYEIWHVIYALDQPGMGKGSLVTGYGPSRPIRWPNEVLEPIYAWDNTADGTNDTAPIQANSLNIEVGVSYFNNTAKPGYTPYTYPHPLDVSSSSK
jgi:hypothetical protein